MTKIIVRMVLWISGAGVALMLLAGMAWAESWWLTIEQFRAASQSLRAAYINGILEAETLRGMTCEKGASGATTIGEVIAAMVNRQNYLPTDPVVVRVRQFYAEVGCTWTTAPPRAGA